VGLGAGDIMIGANFNYQFIDWQHDPIPDEDYAFHHLGTLSSMVLSPSITIGLTDWWNISLSQVIGQRYMTWGGEQDSKHHETETSGNDRANAIGGYLGDSKIIVRYLLLNAGRGSGARLFLGGGLIIPSGNSLISDPFFLDGRPIKSHRHFSMSEGVYKAIIETQFYIKRMQNPVFMGGTVTILESLGENEHGFKASQLMDLSFTAFTSKLKPINGSVSGSFMFRKTNKAYWNGIVAPNSESTLLIPGVGILWNLKFGTIMLNLQKPIFLKGSLSGTDAYLDEETAAWQVSLTIRKILDYTIPWLYW